MSSLKMLSALVECGSQHCVRRSIVTCVKIVFVAANITLRFGVYSRVDLQVYRNRGQAMYQENHRNTKRTASGSQLQPTATYHFPPLACLISEDDRNWLAKQLKACKKQDKVLRAGEQGSNYDVRRCLAVDVCLNVFISFQFVVAVSGDQD